MEILSRTLMFENPREALLEELIARRRNLKRLQRIFQYHEDLFEHLSHKDQPFIAMPERERLVASPSHGLCLT